jgi:hypothetical protein
MEDDLTAEERLVEGRRVKYAGLRDADAIA